MVKSVLERKTKILSERPPVAKNSQFSPLGTRGFTLIEVVIALAIAAIGLAAVTASVSQMVDAANSMQERTYAAWIGQNKITEMRLANIVPNVSATSGELVYAGMEWSWRAEVSETGVENLYRVDVEVGFAAADTFIRTVSGFIGEPTVPGDSNQAWTNASQAIGEEI
jgi:general secretion pathway protein I